MPAVSGVYYSHPFYEKEPGLGKKELAVHNLRMGKKTIWGLLVAVLLLIAAKPADGLTLVYNYASGRTDCYREDSQSQRVWQGTMGPGDTFQITLPFCTFEQSIGGGGNSGALVRVIAKGNMTLTATDPQGVVYSGYVLESYPPKSSIRKCILAETKWYWWGSPYNNWVGVGSVLTGTWTATITNVGDHTVRDIYLEAFVTVFLPGTQQYYCDPAEWRF